MRTEQVSLTQDELENFPLTQRPTLGAFEELSSKKRENLMQKQPPPRECLWSHRIIKSADSREKFVSKSLFKWGRQD